MLLSSMAHPSELILRDVRCFESEQRGRLRPITLLLGENSTGKSTFLACFSVIHRMLSGIEDDIEGSPDFNREPFSMGSFRDIVRSRRGPSGRIDEFQIGIELAQKGKGLPTKVLATFEEQGSQPMQRSRRYEFGSSDFIELQPDGKGKIKLLVPEGEVEVDLPSPLWRLSFGVLAHDLRLEKIPPEARKAIAYIRQLLDFDGNERIAWTSNFMRRPLLDANLVQIAPLRAKPKRTYDPIREIDSPEGEHVPMLMMRLDHGEEKKWRSLHDDLVNFGKQSGLFSDIKVRRHGKQISDPFQLQVKVQSGSHANIMDVGYGVSQSLPILVSLLSANGKGTSPRRVGNASKTFLLQQPEVHLHPRGQAEMAELFARTAKKGRNRFLIETHSDYIVDRMRILVRRKFLRPDDISIIFFEPGKNAVQMHNIYLDKFGNLKNAPDSYRSFFLKETDRLLGFDD